MHLHIAIATALGDVFDYTPELIDAALARHPAIAGDLKVTVGYDGEGFHEAMADADALFAWNFDRSKLAEHAPNLRMIQIQGAGISHLLPLDWIPPRVSLTNSSGAHGPCASEYLLMALLALNNRLPTIVTNQRKHRWLGIDTTSVNDKTLLIYGVGHVGGDAGALAKQFGLNVLGIRRTGAPHPGVDEMHRPAALSELLPKADFILITAPHTPLTDRVFGREEFGLMKAGAGLICYSRAGLVDYDALRECLEAGRISAVVDVFDEEPLPASSPLWDTPNLIITPHCSSNDPINFAPRSLDLLFDNLQRLASGEPLNNVVDPEQLY